MEINSNLFSRSFQKERKDCLPVPRFLRGHVFVSGGENPCKFFVWICGGVARFGDRKPHFCHIKYHTRKRYARFVHVLLTKSKLFSLPGDCSESQFLGNMMPLTHGSVLGIGVFLVWVSGG